jgi:hypothetical protein
MPAISSLMLLLGCLWQLNPEFSAEKKAGTNWALRKTMSPTSKCPISEIRQQLP